MGHYIVGSRRRGEDFDLEIAFKQFLEENAQLQFGQRRADAAVRAGAEREVPPHVLSLDVDPLGIGKHLLVAVRGNVPQRHLVAFADGLAAQSDIFSSSATHINDRRLEADQFIDGIGHQ